MGYYISFTVVKKLGDDWVDARDQSSSIATFVTSKRYDYRCPLVGEDPEFPYQLGIPLGIVGTEILSPYAEPRGWWEFEDIHLPTWNESLRLVTGEVTAKEVSDFGNGKKRISKKRLFDN